jgi:ribosomal protein S18 acetylase RimI-like enzyme
MTIALRIRPLRLSDYESMVGLFELSGLQPRTKGRDSRAAIRRQLRAKSNHYLGAFDGKRLVGTVLGTHDTRKAWINRLAVHPDYRRRGLGKRLIRACERALRSEGLEMFTALIEPENKSSVRVFRSAGYEILPMRYARKKLRRDI